MINSDILSMLDDVIKYSQKAKLDLHNNKDIYAKNIVLMFSTSKALFESLKESIPNV